MVFALAACGSQETTPTGTSPPQETPQNSQSPQAEQPAAGKSWCRNAYKVTPEME